MKYLVHYKSGGIDGRTFITGRGPVTEDRILKWEAIIREKNGFEVAIVSFQEVAP